MHGSHNIIVEAPSQECHRAYFVVFTGRQTSEISNEAVMCVSSI